MKIDFEDLNESWMYIGFVIDGHEYIMGNALVGHEEAKSHLLKFVNIGQKLAYMEINVTKRNVSIVSIANFVNSLIT